MYDDAFQLAGLNLRFSWLRAKNCRDGRFSIWLARVHEAQHVLFFCFAHPFLLSSHFSFLSISPFLDVTKINSSYFFPRRLASN